MIASKFPKRLEIDRTACSGDLGWMHTGTTSTSPSNLNNRDFPSITGKPAFGPIFPYPRTAVPSVTIADSRLLLEYGFYSFEYLRRFSYVK